MMNPSPSPARVAWVDTLKGIGMFSIYVGHFLSLTGLSYAFIFAYGVQVFFFASGFFAMTGKKASLPFFRRLLARARALLLPWLCFSALALIVLGLQNNYALEQMLPLVRQSLLGMRNQTPAIALWFLPALFLIETLYDALWLLFGALPGKKVWIAGLGMVLFIATALLVDPIGQPKWVFSLDSALYFFPFYALGALLYPLLCRSFRGASRPQKAGLAALVLLDLFLTGAIYFAKMLPFYQLCQGIVLFPTLYPFLTACVLIGFLCLLARLLARFPLLAAMGRETLYFCGLETVLKTLLPELVSLTGLTLTLRDPLSVYLYGVVLMLAGHFVLIPIVRRLFGTLFTG